MASLFKRTGDLAGEWLEKYFIISWILAHLDARAKILVVLLAPVSSLDLGSKNSYETSNR